LLATANSELRRIEHSTDSAAIAGLTAASRSSAPASTPSSVTPVTLRKTPSAKSQVQAHRQRVLDAAYAATPERFVRRAPTAPPGSTSPPRPKRTLTKTAKKCLTRLDRLRSSRPILVWEAR
jgi:hypothetical protein